MTILVTGATGNIGRMLVDHLLAGGATDVRALTNDPDRAGLPGGVEVVRGFIGKPETLPDAFAGVEKLYLAPYPATVDVVVSLAAKAGVQHIVDLAGPPDNWWYPVSVAVENSGIAWTHLWPGEFMENATIWADRIRATGTVCEPFPESANAPVAMDDIASVAAVALLEPGHLGKSYTLTGPETLRRTELLDRIGDALGRKLSFETVTREAAIDDLRSSMGDFANTYVDGLESNVDNPQRARSTVADVAGHVTSFREWALQHVAEFR